MIKLWNVIITGLKNPRLSKVNIFFCCTYNSKQEKLIWFCISHQCLVSQIGLHWKTQSVPDKQITTLWYNKKQNSYDVHIRKIMKAKNYIKSNYKEKEQNYKKHGVGTFVHYKPIYENLRTKQTGFFHNVTIKKTQE